MLKVLARVGDNRPLLVLGLTPENYTRLLAGEPILINTTTEFRDAGDDIPAIQIALIGGKDENVMLGNLKKHGFIK